MSKKKDMFGNTVIGKKGKVVTEGNMTITVRAYGYHRNGVGGNGFHVVLFDWLDNEMDQSLVRHMVATYRPESNEDGYYTDTFSPDIAVLDLDECKKGNVAYAGGNMWRGDHFEYCVRKALRTLDPDGWAKPKKEKAGS